MPRLTDPDAILAALAAPYGPEEIDWRVGHTNSDKTKGAALAYQDARTAMDRLDDVCGGLWTCTYEEICGGKIILCRIGIKLGDEWVYRSDGGDAGDGGARDADMELKEALSDAFKRAAVRWGVGRFLYGFASPWVQVVPAGKGVKIADGEKDRLRSITEVEVKKLGWTPARPQRPLPPREVPADGPPRFTAPEPAVPAQPARPASAPHQPGAPSPGPAVTRVEQLAAAIRAEASPGARSQLLATARAELPAALHTFEGAFVDAVCKDLEGAGPDQVERIAGYLRTAGLTRGEQAEQKVRGALAIARSRAA